jgi:serine protease Do
MALDQIVGGIRKVYLKIKQKPIFIIVLVLLLVVALSNRYNKGQFRSQVDNFLKSIQWGVAPPINLPSERLRVVQEESVIVDTVKKVSPSVVTVSIKTPRRSIMDFSPFGGFGRGIQDNEPQDIGTGFVVSADGLIVTNKHVVSGADGKYKITTKDEKVYDVQKIFRDPLNDLAILKIDAKNLKPVEFGDSSRIDVGQLAIAIGTALGEFRNTVTVGVISGVGRGITAGDPFEGYVERLDDVIQTDAAINPGNSGGPLLNSSGQVIGISTAVSERGQNIGFAIPSNVIKNALDQFNRNGGEFQKRPYIGVRYKFINRNLAVLNEIPEGAYIQEVVAGSPAEKAGIEQEDIITRVDGEKLTEGNDLSKMVARRKVGDKVNLEIWRDGTTKTLSVTLDEYPENK